MDPTHRTCALCVDLKGRQRSNQNRCEERGDNYWFPSGRPRDAGRFHWLRDRRRIDFRGLWIDDGHKGLSAHLVLPKEVSLGLWHELALRLESWSRSEVVVLTAERVRGKHQAPHTGGGKTFEGPSCRLWLHALVSTAALVLLLLLAAPGYRLHDDEAAALAQVEALASTGEWGVEHPYPAVDPDNQAFPVPLSEVVGEHKVAPYSKHPLYPLALILPVAIGGTVGGVLLSIVGFAIAAYASGLLALRLFDTSVARLCVWLTAFGTPLWFDAGMVNAHTLAAGLSAVAAVGVVDYLRRLKPSGWSLIAGPCFVAAILLRTEVRLLGIASVLVLAAMALRRRHRTSAIAGVAVFGTTLLAWVLDNLLHRLTGATLTLTHTSGGAPPSRIADRVEGFVITWLRPSHFTPGWVQLCSLFGAVLFAAAALVYRRRPAAIPAVSALAATGSALGLARAVLDSYGMVTGLFVAAPVFISSLLLLEPDDVRERQASFCLGAAAVFSLGVLATQYSNGGGGEWGGRYFAVGLPLATPFAARGAVRAWHQLGPAKRFVATSAVVLQVSLLVVGLSTMKVLHSSDRLVGTEMRSLIDDNRGADPVVITTSGWLGRMVYSPELQVRWLTAKKSDLTMFADRVRADGAGTVILVTDDPKELESVRGFSAVRKHALATGATAYVMKRVDP